jgi:spermidine/putrescine transport system substrate-binding protein
MTKLIERLQRHGVLRVDRRGIACIRSTGPISRRRFGGGLLAAGTAAVLGRRALAAAEVKFMGWQSYEEGFGAGEFLTRNDIRLNPTYMNDNNQLIATATGGGIGNMDIITPDTSYTPMMAEIGMLEPLDMSRIPNFANLFPEFQTITGASVEGVQYSLPYVWGSIPLMYNPAVVKVRPTSWLDILKPEYKGKVALTNDVISVMIPFAMAATGTKTPTRITQAELDQTVDLLMRIKKEHARTIATGYGELADLFASGEVIMAQAWEPVAIWAEDKGTKLDWTVPKEGTHTLCDCLALVKNAPSLDAAYLLLNQGMTAEAQALVANANNTGVTVKDAVPLLNERARRIYPYDDIPSFFASTGGGPFPLWPLDREGDIVSMDDVLNGWERFLKA